MLVSKTLRPILDFNIFESDSLMRRFKVALTVITLAISGLSASPAFAVSDGSIPCVTDGPVTGSGSFTIENNAVTAHTDCTGRAVIPDGVTTIGTGAFLFANGLTSIAIPTSVRIIEANAFQYATGLTSVAIPSGVTTIGNSAFVYASGLTSITIPASVTTIGTGAFNNNVSLTSISVAPENINYKSINGVLFNKSGKTLIHYPVELSSSSYTIPSGVTTIGAEAFRGASRLTSITIPSGVKTIEDSAFNLVSGLTSVTIPASVTTIGASAFNRASSLRSITFKPDSKLTIIGGYAFYAATSLTSIRIPASVRTIDELAFSDATALAAVTFESGSALATIADNAFDSANSLTSIRIPSSVTTIGASAFRSTTALNSIYFLGNAPASVGTNAFTGAGGKDGSTAYRKSSAKGFASVGSQWRGLEVAIGVYTATFKSNGGSSVASTDFIKNGSITSAPKTPTRSGYSFAGWSPSKDGSAITFPYTPGKNKNITLYAKWTKSSSNSTPEIEFSTSSTVLTNTHKIALKKLVKSHGKNAIFTIIGTAGRLPGASDAQVKNLAKSRANVVKAYLVKLGVKKANIKVNAKVVNQGIVPKTKILTRYLDS